MPTTIFSVTLNSTDNGFDGYTIRQTCTTLSGGAQDQIRVTFNASSGQGFKTDHCSIGICTNNGTTNADTTSTPTELLFSGVSGFTLGVGASITSDWLNFTGFTSASTLVVIMDVAAAGGPYGVERNTSATAQVWYHVAATSYNSTTTPGGSTPVGSQDDGVASIETQLTGGGATFVLMGQICA